MKSEWCKFANHINQKGGLYFGPMGEDHAFSKMFRKLISEEEAKLGQLVPKIPTSTRELAEKSGLSEQEAQKMLTHMAQKGVVFERIVKNTHYYNITPFIPGFYEYVMTDPETRNDPEMAALFTDISSSGPMNRMMSGQDGGLLKVTPVMKEIYAQQKVYSFEDVMTFINKAHSFSSADCACRLSMRLIGKGCEHPVEDTCLQLDDTAEYYIRTGRGKRLTKEEAIALLERVEKAGLVHTAFTVEGKDETSFICNCCGCSCSGLRALNIYDGNPFSRSNFRASINEENCVACGECVKICPVNAVTLGTNLCGDEKSQTPAYKQAATHRITKKDEHPDFINERKTVAKMGTSPCKTRCPAHISVQGYIQKAAEGDYLGALEVIKKDNPLPAVCGRICPHPCEAECTRGSIDEPLAIDAIKMFIADKEREDVHKFIPNKKNNFKEKAAIIGSGPAGISCAYYLAEFGYKVTVFEKQEKLGGMLTLGIPSFRLEKDVVESEITVLKELGVEFVTDTEVGKDITISQLREKGFDAIYLAIGAQESAKLNIEGEELEHVIPGIDFLRSINLGKADKLNGRAIVIGGGNVAIDVARSAIRQGASSVDMYCLESEEEMPAALDEQLEAKEEGIRIHHGWGPKQILGENQTVKSVVFKRCLSVKENGRFAPKYDENDVITVDGEVVLLAIGQRISWGSLLDNSQAEIGNGNRIVVNNISYQSSAADIFAGGDVVTGPRFAIDAIAMGKQGAISIHRFLRNMHLTNGRNIEYRAIDKNNLEIGSYDAVPRQKTTETDYQKAVRTFHDLRKGLSEEQIKKETQRCLHCGRSIVDTDKCIGCGVCTHRCEFDAIHLTRVSDSTPAGNFPTFYKRMATYSVKRAGRILTNSFHRNERKGC